MVMIGVPSLRAVGAGQVATPVPSSGSAVLTEATIDFPMGIRFQADLGSLPGEMADRIEFRYTIAGSDTEHQVFVPASGRTGAGGEIIDLTVDLQSEFVPAGVTLEYHWEFHAGSDVIGETTPERILWYDMRWTWDTTRSEQIVLHSHSLTTGFTSSILTLAQSTVTDLERRYALTRSQPVDIWVYPTAEDFRGAQQQNSREAVAGASYPGFFLIVAVIPEGDAREAGRVIPHEISHQVLYQATRNPFSPPPVWFDEGLATHYQIGGTDGFPAMVSAALQENRLFELGSLDTTFPYLPAQATLAYAASWSAVEFIKQRYGDDGIERLIAAFATGAPFDEAIQHALGVRLDQLDGHWRDWIAQPETSVARHRIALVVTSPIAA